MAIQKLTPDPQIPFPPTDTEAQKNLDEWADQITFQLTKMIFSLNTSVNRLIDKVRDAIVFATTTYTIKENDATILANATGGAFSVTLPTAVGLQGQRYFIKKTDSSANAVTVATTSSQKIDGATTFSLSTQYAKVTVISDNANWQIVA